MPSPGFSSRVFLPLCLITLVSSAFLMSRLRVTNQVYIKIQEGQSGDAHIGLMPQRQGLLNLDVAIIVPYRDRAIHLKIFINYMNTFLLLQNSSARIYIVEQHGKDDFNRAKLFNIGYVEAKKDYNYSCFIFHDVDLIPENPKLAYQCRNQPVHFSVFLDKWNYRRIFPNYFGGVSGLSELQLKDVNGFPNRYWGWGGEDNDICRRVVKKNYTIYRPPPDLSRYTMLRFTGKHVFAKANRQRDRLLRKAEAEMARDGLSNLDYELIKKKDHKTFIWLLADPKHNGV